MKWKVLGAGSVQFTSDPSFGDAGLISLSTISGRLLATDPGVAYARGAWNSLYAATTGSTNGPVAVGTTY